MAKKSKKEINNKDLRIERNGWFLEYHLIGASEKQKQQFKEKILDISEPNSFKEINENCIIFKCKYGMDYRIVDDLISAAVERLEIKPGKYKLLSIPLNKINHQ